VKETFDPVADVSTIGPKPLVAPSVSFADPFGGFVGHSFLHFCQFVELMYGWTRTRLASAEMTAESLLNAPSHSSLKNWGSCSLGTICCTVVAAGLIPLFNASSIKSILPIPFLVIIVLVAFRFGRAAGVLGTLTAAFLFAYYLFEPAGLAVSDPVARDHLIWMLVIGIVISDLMARFKVRRQLHKL
jgi:K+-sensing histidine kinase KdpD